MPGPHFKPALEAAFESQLDGAFYDELTGLEWMRNYLRAHPEALQNPLPRHESTRPA
jgi:tRNA nucleotidyltransferase (CCA-adding enzyme)